MSRRIVIESTTGIGIAATILAAGLAIGGGAFFGGYVLGERNAPEQVLQTELDVKTYTVEDLEAALASCELDGAAIEESSVTLTGGEWPASNRQCFIAEMDAPEIADREYTGTLGPGQPEEGEYSWSNVHMDWEQTDEGRDVTITVK